jgi:hypothetical protein
MRSQKKLQKEKKRARAKEKMTPKTRKIRNDRLSPEMVYKFYSVDEISKD